MTGQELQNDLLVIAARIEKNRNEIDALAASVASCARSVQRIAVPDQKEIGKLIYNGYPVSYWHQQAIHYRQRMIELARLADTSIDAEPAPDGMDRE